MYRTFESRSIFIRISPVGSIDIASMFNEIGFCTDNLLHLALLPGKTPCANKTSENGSKTPPPKPKRLAKKPGRCETPRIQLEVKWIYPIDPRVRELVCGGMPAPVHRHG